MRTGKGTSPERTRMVLGRLDLLTPSAWQNRTPRRRCSLHLRGFRRQCHWGGGGRGRRGLPDHGQKHLASPSHDDCLLHTALPQPMHPARAPVPRATQASRLEKSPQGETIRSRAKTAPTGVSSLMYSNAIYLVTRRGRATDFLGVRVSGFTGESLASDSKMGQSGRSSPWQQ